MRGQWVSEAYRPACTGRMSRETRAATARVYFIRHTDGLVKIGWAEDPRKRLAELQTANPTPLVLLATIAGGPPLEAALHQLFARHRAAGEWFRPAPALLTLLDDILEAAAREEATIQ